jgi:hypothetical protein
MATSRHSAPALSRRSYTAVGSFGLAFFKYEYKMNPQTSVEEAKLEAYGTNADCPVGRILYENGKKIVPTSAPFPPIMITGLIGTNVLTSYMVGVFDPQSGLSGFIDPNSPNFAIVSTDKPVYLNNDVGYGPSTNIKNLGNPVVTHGSVLSLINEGNVGVPLPNYVGVATANVDYLNFGGEGNDSQGIFDGPYALSISQGMGGVSVGFATGEGGNPSETNWAGMYGDGNVYHTGMMYSKRTVGVSPPMDGAPNNSSVTINNVFMGFTGQTPIVLLTYANFSRSGGTSGPGVLTYTLTRNTNSNDEFGTLVIYSTAPYDTSNVNYFLISGSFGLD